MVLPLRDEDVTDDPEKYAASLDDDMRGVFSLLVRQACVCGFEILGLGCKVLVKGFGFGGVVWCGVSSIHPSTLGRSVCKYNLIIT